MFEFQGKSLGFVVALVAVVVACFGSTSAGAVPTSGRTLTLKSDDQYLRITLLTWRNNARGSNEFDTPSPGHRYLAVKLKIRNLSKSTYDDAPTNGAVLEDTRHRQYDPTFGGPEPSLQGDVRILRNDWVVGWITFEVPKKAKPRLFEFTLDSGFAENSGATGVWHFR